MQHHLRTDLFKDGVYDPRETKVVISTARGATGCFSTHLVDLTIRETIDRSAPASADQQPTRNLLEFMVPRFVQQKRRTLTR